MSSVASAQPLQSVVLELTDAVWLFVLLTGGLVGMSIRNMLEGIVSDEDGADDGDDDGADDLGGGGLMADDDDGGDDLGGLGGLDGGDDDLGGFGDDDFGDMDGGGGGGGGNVDELEHRLDELETEVGSLSSTVNTVRNENEQISESVEEVEENVRKLLDIYEMVTRGVNPFADDIDAGMGGGGGMGGGDGSFGLFGDDDGGGGGGGGDDNLDDDIAEADAEGFFDEDLVKDDGSGMDMGGDALGGDGMDMGGEEDFGDGFDDDFDDSFADDFETANGTESADTDDSGDDGGGTSFADLKDEYESGEADWADDEDGDGGSDDEVLADEGTAVGTETDGEFEDVDGEDGAFGDGLDEDELFDEVIEDGAEDSTATPDEATPDEAAVETEPEPELTTDAEAHSDTEPTTEPEPTTDAEAHSDTEPDTERRSRSGSPGTGKPYLATLPEGYAVDLIVVEWLEFLVEEAGVRETARAIDYYESIDWVDEQVADDLQEYLRGFESSTTGTLTIDHHTQSLKYISQLNGGAAAVGVMGGGVDGIQR